MKNIITAFVVKSNVIAAAMVLTLCLCAWGWLAAQSDGEKVTSPAITSANSPLLEIREPSQEDFEHCAKRAVDFFESWSDDQEKNETALREFFEFSDYPPETIAMINGMLTGKAKSLASFKKEDITYGSPELMIRRSFGENVIILCYHYHTDKWPLYCRFCFERTFDKNGEPLKWRCQPSGFDADNNIARVIY